MLIVSLVLILLPIAASLRRAYMLKQKGTGFENDSFWSLFINSLYSKYS